MAYAQTESGKTAASLLAVITNLFKKGASQISSYDGPHTHYAHLWHQLKNLLYRYFKKEKSLRLAVP